MVFSIGQPFEFVALVVVFGFAAYRLTRLITKDVIFEEIRAATIVWLAQLPEGGFRKTGLRSKLAYMISCDFCVGIWVGLLLSVVTALLFGFDNWFSFLVFWFSVTGVQSKLSG